MSRSSRFEQMVSEGEGPRRARLIAAGRTVELSQVAPDDHVVVIAMGFGDEYWRVRRGFRANVLEGVVEGGELILENGARVTDAARLAFLKRRIDQIVWAI